MTSKPKRRRKPAPTPVKVRRLFQPRDAESTLAETILWTALEASEDAWLHLDAVAGEMRRYRQEDVTTAACACGMPAPDEPPGSGHTIWDHLIAASAFLQCDDAAREQIGKHLVNWLSTVAWGLAFVGETPPALPGGLRLEALWPGQRARYRWVDGQRVRFRNGAGPSELKRLQDYELWEAERATGEPAALRGKSDGDGELWAGGLPHFLEDLWTTLETLTRATGTRYGHDPASRRFRESMSERPGGRTLRKWMRKAEIECRQIKAGEVTRANYAQFVAK